MPPIGFSTSAGFSHTLGHAAAIATVSLAGLHAAREAEGERSAAVLNVVAIKLTECTYTLV